MSEERHSRLKELFAAARERPPAERSAFLDDACTDDELRSEVLSLLAYDFSRTPDPDAKALDFPAGGFPPGTMLAGRYRIDEVLGRGGMGEIYRAEDLKLGQPVALKFLLAAVRDDPARLERLLDEVRIARLISHPNVCRVYDVSEADGAHFLSMEYINGEDVAALLRRVGRLPQDRARSIGLELCEGLAAVHGQGILHRDLKPSNVMLDVEGRVRLVDFGMAAVAGAEARGGTPAYMAPELYAGEASVKSDLYALGLVLYELFTGQPAFKAGSPSELERLHREVAPQPPGDWVDGLAGATERVILECLEKDAAARPASLRAVAAALSEGKGGTAGAALPRAAVRPYPEVESGARLRRWPPPELPEQPYPMLLPYTHAALFAGRGRELRELRRRLRLPLPILGLYAASGTGKSSLLGAGLVPALRDAGVPVALERHPREPAPARRLLADLLEMEEPVGDAPATFAELLGQAARLAGKAPLLVVDQFEDALRSAEARAFLGILLAATAERRPGVSGPLCRWVLAYRQEYHGEVVTWLGDVLAEARAAGLGVAAEWPHDLATADRFHAVKLSPLGTPAPRSGLAASPAAALDELAGVFRDVLEKPLALTGDDGTPRYPWRFAGDGAERLARAFAEARRARPEAPLTPELQVVLSHLLAQTGPDGLLEVPEDPGPLISEALEDHLWRALEAAFPTAAGTVARLADARTGRTRALLALRELATATGPRQAGRRGEGLAPEELTRAIGEDGEEVLERLATPLTRLVVLQKRPDGSFRYVLSHDRLAKVVVRMVEEEGRRGQLTVDREVLALRRFVTLQSALYRSQKDMATRLGRRHRRRIAKNAAALLWDDERRAWWDACCERHRADRRHTLSLTVAAILFLTLVAWGTWNQVRQRRERQALLDQVVLGEPETALQAFDRLAKRSGDTTTRELCSLLFQRALRASRPSGETGWGQDRSMDLLELGLEGIREEERSAVVLRTVEIALPWIREKPDNSMLIANVVWVLDFVPGRDPPFARKARVLRDRVLEPLRQWRPPPAAPGPEDPDWADIPAGSFQMGSADGEDAPSEERPRHEVTLSAFRMLRHEVTNAELRLLWPDHPGDDDQPAGLRWHDAYTYAAWRGGRLPTEAEWEYAARAGCPYTHCTAEGEETTLDAVARTRRESWDPETGEIVLGPVMQLEPNPWGLYDMLGNVWEWTADWYAEYSAESQRDPWTRVATVGNARRVIRGGSSWTTPDGAGLRVAYRGRAEPSVAAPNHGFRIVLPGRPDP